MIGCLQTTFKWGCVLVTDHDYIPCTKHQTGSITDYIK